MNLLEKQLYQGQTSHAYIFESRDLDLAKNNASEFIGKLLEPSHGGKVFDRDLMTIGRGGENIKIDSIRQMIKFFQTRPFYGDYKIALIEDGSRLRVESSNAMLRILEDLPSYGKIIILIRNAEELLPTIRSRCQLIKFESRDDYGLDTDFIEGLVDSFINQDLTVNIKNKKEIEDMKEDGREFFAIAIDYLMKLRLEDNTYDDKVIEESISRAIELSKNLKNNVNFILSVEYFALGFLE